MSARINAWVERCNEDLRLIDIRGPVLKPEDNGIMIVETLVTDEQGAASLFAVGCLLGYAVVWNADTGAIYNIGSRVTMQVIGDRIHKFNRRGSNSATWRSAINNLTADKGICDLRSRYAKHRIRLLAIQHRVVEEFPGFRRTPQELGGKYAECEVVLRNVDKPIKGHERRPLRLGGCVWTPEYYYKGQVFKAWGMRHGSGLDFDPTFEMPYSKTWNGTEFK